MMRENACSVVYGDGIHWAQDYTDYGYGNGGRDEGRHEPNYQLETLFFSRWWMLEFNQKMRKGGDLQHRDEGVNVDCFNGP